MPVPCPVSIYRVICRSSSLLLLLILPPHSHDSSSHCDWITAIPSFLPSFLPPSILAKLIPFRLWCMIFLSHHPRQLAYAYASTLLLRSFLSFLILLSNSASPLFFLHKPTLEQYFLHSLSCVLLVSTVFCVFRVSCTRSVFSCVCAPLFVCPFLFLSLSLSLSFVRVLFPGSVRCAPCALLALLLLRVYTCSLPCISIVASLILIPHSPSPSSYLPILELISSISMYSLFTCGPPIGCVLRSLCALHSIRVFSSKCK